MIRTDRRTLLSVGIGATAAAATLPLAPLKAAEVAELSGAAISNDLALLEDAYAAMHPGLDRYLGTARWKALIALERTRLLAGPRRPADLFLALARLTAAVRCGHTYPNPVNQGRALRTTLLDGRDRVPFAFRWLGGRMVVTRSLLPGLPVRPGDEIEAIDGLACPKLLGRLLPLARADGHNDAKRLALMEVDGNGRFGAFDVYRPLVNPARNDGTIALRVAGRTITVPAMTDAERQAGATDMTEDGGWRFGLEDGVGKLTMPTWALYNSKWDWRGFIASCCDRLVNERARGLIVDLRANEGGQDCGDVLLARLIERPLTMPAYDRLVRYREAPERLRPHLDTWDPSFADWGTAARSDPREGFFRLVRDSDDETPTIQPVGPRFAGKVAVLVSPTCSSATFEFAQAARLSGRAVLVGEPTGGNRRGINGGAFFFLRLPETKFEVDLPLIGQFPKTPQPDAGLVPDRLVTPTRADIASGRDRALAEALRLVA